MLNLANSLAATRVRASTPALEALEMDRRDKDVSKVSKFQSKEELQRVDGLL